MSDIFKFVSSICLSSEKLEKFDLENLAQGQGGEKRTYAIWLEMFESI